MPRGELVRVGNYNLLRLLAHGGMADVYLARREGEGEDRQVALKILAANRAEDSESCALFLDEGRLVTHLVHQNIAEVFDVAIEDGVHFIAMEHVHGFDLRDTLNTAMHVHHHIPYATALSIVCAAGRGLDHAHRASGPDGKSLELVHRDVSLSNIMLGHDGSVKIVDFGIARTSLSSVHTQPGVVRGKASYMAPEQCMGDKIDRRTDVFALGIVLYEITTGARCFPGLTDFDRMLAIVRGQWNRPSNLVDGYPRELEEIIETALAIDPNRRYTSIAAMVAALERVALVNDWTLGTAAIRCLMSAVFGEHATPVVSCDIDAIEPTMPELEALASSLELDPFEAAIAGIREDSISMVIDVAPMPTRTASVVRRKRLARGTEADGFYDGSLAAKQDEWATERDRPPRRKSTRSLFAA